MSFRGEAHVNPIVAKTLTVMSITTWHSMAGSLIHTILGCKTEISGSKGLLQPPGRWATIGPPTCSNSDQKRATR